MSHDRQFFDTFMLILGALFAVTIALFFLARQIHAETKGQHHLEDPAVLAKTSERIAPVGRVVLDGEADVSAAPAAAETVVAQVRTGPEVDDMAGMACHTTGAGGAPKIGDAAAWTDRISQGQATLVQHAINGFQGNAGYMPAKGGRADLTDDEVSSAVDYMIEKSK